MSFAICWSFKASEAAVFGVKAVVLLGFDGVVVDDVSVEVFGVCGWDACAMIKFEGGGG